MNEKQIEETYVKYTKDEKKLREIKIEKKSKRWTNFVSILFVVLAISFQVGIHAIGAYFSYTAKTGYEKEVALIEEKGGDINTVMDNRQAPIIWHLLVGAVSGTAMISLLFVYFFSNYEKSGREYVQEFFMKKFDKDEEEKKLISETEKREEFFRLYEMLKDPDYRNAYFSSMKPSLEDFEKALGKNRGLRC